MKRQKMQLLVLLAVLLVLAGSLLVLRQYNKTRSEETDTVQGEVIADFGIEEIVRFSYDYEDNNYSYEKLEDTWQYARNHDLNLNQYRVESMLSNVTPFVAEGIIRDVKDMSQYGLDEPERTISFETDTESYIFHVGDYNSVSSVYYICRPSDTTVYAVAAAAINGFNVEVLDIVEAESSVSE